MNEDDDMSAEGIAVCSVVESGSEEESDEPEQEQFDTVADVMTPVKKKKERKTFSIAHRWLDEGNAVLVHIDLETGGEQCGVIQLSTVIYDVGLRLVVGEFNRYVRPPDDAVWNSHACVHGLSASSESIKSADTLVKVWTEFVKFIEKYTSEKMGIIVAWGGKSCDIKWMWKITEETHVGECIMPKNCEFFLDPIDTIKHYKRCPLNKNNSSILGYGLATVWCYLKNQKELIGAHDSLIDAQAQSAICDDDKFFSFLDKPVGIVTLNSILEPKRKKRRQQEEELRRQLPVGWSAFCVTKDIPVAQMAYNSHSGGGHRGPSSKVSSILHSRCIVDLFLFFFTPDILETIARETNRYGNEEWVMESKQFHTTDNSDSESSDDEGRKKRVLVQVKSSFKGEKRKRYVKRGSRDWVKVTPGYLLVFFGIILISGAMKVRKTNMLWGTKWQTGLPMVQNACTRDSFNQIRQYIHFVDNMKLLPKDHPRWDPLQKIQPILDLLLKQLALAYVLGDRLSIDEAMIKYCGKFVSFVQYMPKKPTITLLLLLVEFLHRLPIDTEIMKYSS